MKLTHKQRIYVRTLMEPYRVQPARLYWLNYHMKNSGVMWAFEVMWGEADPVAARDTDLDRLQSLYSCLYIQS